MFVGCGGAGSGEGKECEAAVGTNGAAFPGMAGLVCSTLV